MKKTEELQKKLKESKIEKATLKVDLEKKVEEKIDFKEKISKAYYSGTTIMLNDKIIKEVKFKNDLIFIVEDYSIEDIEKSEIFFNYNDFEYKFEVKLHEYNKTLIFDKEESNSSVYKPKSIKIEKYALSSIEESFPILKISQIGYEEIIFESLKKEEDLIVTNIGQIIPIIFEEEDFSFFLKYKILENSNGIIKYTSEILFENEESKEKYKNYVEGIKTKDNIKRKEIEFNNLIKETVKI